MASCLSGAGGRTYGFDFDFVKSQSKSIRTSPSSSSSTISESSNSPLAISTRKPRTPRKRPNQTYNEAAALLSTAYPNLFSTKNLKKPGGKFTKPAETFSDESSELLLPFRVFDSSSFLLHQPIQLRPSFPAEPKVVNVQEKPCPSPGEISSRVNSLELDDDCREDFDAESILDEEIEEGIDSIMGSMAEDCNGASCHSEGANPWGFGGKLDFQVGLQRARVRALRHRVDDGNWWNFPAVDILEISPKINKPPVVSVLTTEKKKKKNMKKVVEKPIVELMNSEFPRENSIPKSNPGLLLKLNYDEVRNAWSDRGSPFADESPGSDVPGNDVTERLGEKSGKKFEEARKKHPSN